MKSFPLLLSVFGAVCVLAGPLAAQSFPQHDRGWGTQPERGWGGAAPGNWGERPSWPAPSVGGRGPMGGQPLIVQPAGGGGCTLYEHVNGGGQSWRVEAAHRDRRNPSAFVQAQDSFGPWWNDRVSSVQCDETRAVSCWAELYEHNGFQGRRETVRPGQRTNLGALHDRASSIQVTCAPRR